VTRSPDGAVTVRAAVNRAIIVKFNRLFRV
jgi:hypothetical protein